LINTHVRMMSVSLMFKFRLLSVLCWCRYNSEWRYIIKYDLLMILREGTYFFEPPCT